MIALGFLVTKWLSRDATGKAYTPQPAADPGVLTKGKNIAATAYRAPQKVSPEIISPEKIPGQPRRKNNFRQEKISKTRCVSEKSLKR